MLGGLKISPACSDACRDFYRGAVFLIHGTFFIDVGENEVVPKYGRKRFVNHGAISVCGAVGVSIR